MRAPEITKQERNSHDDSSITLPPPQHNFPSPAQHPQEKDIFLAVSISLSYRHHIFLPSFTVNGPLYYPPLLSAESERARTLWGRFPGSIGGQKDVLKVSPGHPNPGQ